MVNLGWFPFLVSPFWLEKYHTCLVYMCRLLSIKKLDLLDTHALAIYSALCAYSCFHFTNLFWFRGMGNGRKETFSRASVPLLCELIELRTF